MPETDENSSLESNMKESSVSASTSVPEELGAGAETTPTPGTDLSLENEKLREEINDLKDQYLRKAAEMENQRKRVMREKDEAIRYANGLLLNDVVNLLDDFERAIGSSESSRDYDTFHEGIQMIENQFVSLLERKHGLKRLHAKGEVFDPEFHEAIAGSAVESPVVLEVYQNGYLLHDRVLRPARVRVGPQEELATPEETKKED